MNSTTRFLRAALNHQNDLLMNLGLLAAVVGAAYLVRELLLFVARRWVRTRKVLPADYPLRNHFDTPLVLVLLAAGLEVVSPWLTLKPAHEALVSQALQIIAVVSLTWFLLALISLVKEILIGRFDVSVADNIRQRKIRTQLEFIHKTVVLVVLVVGISGVLLSFSGARRIGASLLASAGVASVVIGIAAQKSLANLLAGFQIAFTQPIRIDDVVIVENEWGRIEEISFTYVVVKLWDLRRLVLPINYFIDKPFQNWTRTTSNIIGSAFFHLDFSVPVDAVREEFERILKDSPLWDGQTKALQVTDTTDKTIEVRVIMSSRNASESFDLRCIVREKIVAFLQRAYPHALPFARAELVVRQAGELPTETVRRTGASTGHPAEIVARELSGAAEREDQRPPPV